MALQVNGKTYDPQFISLLKFKKILKLEQAYIAKEQEAEKTDDPVDTDTAWIAYCSEILNGDVSDLSLAKITPMQYKEINDFFALLFGGKIPTNG